MRCTGSTRFSTFRWRTLLNDNVSIRQWTVHFDLCFKTGRTNPVIWWCNVNKMDWSLEFLWLRCYVVKWRFCCYYLAFLLARVWKRRVLTHIFPSCISQYQKYHNTLFVCPSKILHKHCFQFLLGPLWVPRENLNNAYAKFWRDKQRLLWYFW